MEIREIWSVPEDRIGKFFCAQSDSSKTENGCFCFEGCEVRLKPLSERRVGAFSFPRTEITFAGEKDAVEEIYHRFFLQFISAGA